MAITHSTPADASMSEAGKAAWNADHTGTWPAGDVSFTQSGSGAVSSTVQAYLRSLKVILGWIPTASWAGIAAGTNTDDLTSYIASALTDVAGAQLYFPAGTYYCNVTTLPSNTYIYGDGEATIIRPKTTTSSIFQCDSGSDSAYITGIVFRDLKLFSTVATDGFDSGEDSALLKLTGVKRCRIENVYFEGFRSDGLYLGGHSGVTARHNVDVIVKNCIFDGINNDNRNGASVIDGDSIEFDGCIFRNCAKSTMPGSLDFEPNLSTNVIKNVRVVNSRFYNTDGNRGHVVFSTQDADKDNVQNIVISGNHFENADIDNGAVTFNFDTAAPTNPQHIVIANNTCIMTAGNFVWKRDGYSDGIVITGNTVRALRGVWFDDATSGDDTDLLIAVNHFSCTSRAVILTSANLDNINIRGNIFNLSGTPVAHVQIGANDDSSKIIICDNDFIGSPSTASINHTSTTKNATTNLCANNRFDSVPNFKAYYRDNIGYVTEASGTGAVASGATTAVVTHGLSVTPTLDDITIVFGEQGTNDYGRWSVGTIGATQFTLTVAADPGASGLDFGWRANVVRAIT
jgi:hypothetical protein